MGREELIKKLMPTFVAELETHVDDFNRELMALETIENIENGNETLLLFMRTAHSLKGASRSVSLTVIESCCHKIEDLVGLCLKKQAFSAAIFQAFFFCVDSLQETSSRLKQQSESAQEPLNQANLLLDGIIVAISCDSPLPPLPVPLTARVAMAETASDTVLLPATAQTVPAPLPITASGHSAQVHVKADQLDKLMNDATELLVESGQLQSRIDSLEEIRNQLSQEVVKLSSLKRKVRSKGHMSEHHLEQLSLDNFKLDKVVRELDQLIAAVIKEKRDTVLTVKSINSGVQKLRLVTFESTCQSFERTVRDLAKSTGKKVQLEIRGGEVGLDRSIAEELKAPLLHLVRNAVDHGVETPEKRLLLKKPVSARIVLTASVEGSVLTVTIADDGAGIDSEAIKDRAQQQGLSDSNLDLIFLPGFSTAKMITEISGRGLGLDVVKSTIERVGGQITLSSMPGQGTTFELKVPTTLTTTRALIIQELGQSYAIMVSNVVKVLRLTSHDFIKVDGQDAVMLDGAVIRALSLRSILGAETAPLSSSAISALLINADKTNLILIADKLIAEKEIVIKSLNERLNLRLFLGTTILDTGNVALILNTPEVIRSASQALAGLKTAGSTESRKIRILVADDSITTRSMEKNILEGAGYEVITANDGAQAWRLLQEKGADLVVSDVEMPNMDGFNFAKTVRSSKTFSDIPFILVTALAKDSDKARGIEVGASAYLVKSEFEQDNLLEVIRQLL